MKECHAIRMIPGESGVWSGFKPQISFYWSANYCTVFGWIMKVLSALQENPLLGIFRDKPMKAVVRCLAIHNNQ